MSQPKPTSKGAAPAPGQSDFLNDWALRAEADDTAKPGGWRKVALPAAIAGIVFVVLYVISFYLLAKTPLGNATDAEIIAYYGDGTNLTLTLAGMLVMPFVGIAFLYFMVLLRAMARATGPAPAGCWATRNWRREPFSLRCSLWRPPGWWRRRPPCVSPVCRPTRLRRASCPFSA